MARTTYEWTLTDFAAWAVGLITVPVYPTSSASQARHILQDAGVRACFVEDVEQSRPISAERGNLPALEHLWSSARAPWAMWWTRGGRSPTRGGRAPRRVWARRASPPSSTPRAPRVRPRDVCSRTATSSPRWTTRSNCCTRSSGRSARIRRPRCCSFRCRTSSAGWSRSAVCAPGCGWGTRRASGPRTCWPTSRASGRRFCWASRTCWRRSTTPAGPRRRRWGARRPSTGARGSRSATVRPSRRRNTGSGLVPAWGCGPRARSTTR